MCLQILCPNKNYRLYCERQNNTIWCFPDGHHRICTEVVILPSYPLMAACENHFTNAEISYLNDRYDITRLVNKKPILRYFLSETERGSVHPVPINTSFNQN